MQTNTTINITEKINNKQISIKKLDWKKTSLWLPFLLLSLIMVIIPLLIVLITAFIPVEGYTVGDNWVILNSTIWEKIAKSLWISIVSTLICLLISYPFCYFLTQFKSKWLKRIVFTIATMPMWLGSMIILISLKLVLDKINGSINSTYGDFYTIIGIVYLYIPLMMIPLYNTLEQLPQNLINASKDLGRGNIYTFFHVVIPFSKYALISGISMVLLPSMSVVAVPQFLNNSPNGSLIGDIIMNQGLQATDSNIALARVCVLSVVVSIIMFLVYMLIVSTPKIWNQIMRLKTRKELLKHEK